MFRRLLRVKAWRTGKMQRISTTLNKYVFLNSGLCKDWQDDEGKNVLIRRAKEPRLIACDSASACIARMTVPTLSVPQGAHFLFVCKTSD